MAQVCPFCGIDEFVTKIPLGPGYFEFTCGRAAKHPNSKPCTWKGTATDVDTTGLSGPVPYQDVLNGLRAAIVNHEPWIEYGIVEKRYAAIATHDFEILREAYGHRILGPSLSRHFTVSAYLAKALGVLRDKGELAHMTYRATGLWSYNSSISYWAAPPPGPSKTETTTFEEYVRSG